MKLEQIAQDPVRCVPLPDWIDHQPYRTDIPDTESSCIGNGICQLLRDSQLDLRNPEQAQHFRSVQRVLTREGAERAAHVVIEFDPGFQRIEVHFVRVLRAGEAIEHARADAFQLLRRETNLERLVFDGRLTASLLIPDVRIGDIVELGVTLYGGVPVLDGRHTAWVVFDSFNPWFEHRYRILRPLERDVAAKAYNDPPQPVIAVTGKVEDIRWQLVGQQRRSFEPLTPPWQLLRPALQFSEFKSWNEVASLLAPFYEGGALRPTVAEEVDRLAGTYPEPDRRAVELLRLVQRELRYFAFSVGEGGLTPRSLDTIWGTRFGDCKDAASLYVAGARRMGLDACAALISTTHGYALSRFLPSSAVFDHCIVRLRLDGVSYWLDPTATVQGGALRNVFQPHIGWALPLSTETTELEQLKGEEPLHALHWEDEITVGPKVTSPATLRRTIDYFYWGADAVRSRIANDGASGFAQALLRDLQAVWPSVAETAPMQISEDKDRNKVTLTLNYQISDCWKPTEDGSRLKLIVLRTPNRELQPILAERRETDIVLGRPRKLTGFLQLNMPCGWDGGAWLHQLEASHITFVDRYSNAGRTTIASRELVVDAWSLPAEESRAYNDIAKKLTEDLLVVFGTVRFGRIRPWRSTKTRLAQGGALLLYVLWGLGALFVVLGALLTPR